MLLTLPDEILQQIIEFCCLCSLKQLYSTCKRLHSLVRWHPIWFDIYQLLATRHVRNIGHIDRHIPPFTPLCLTWAKHHNYTYTLSPSQWKRLPIVFLWTATGGCKHASHYRPTVYWQPKRNTNKPYLQSALIQIKRLSKSRKDRGNGTVLLCVPG